MATVNVGDAKARLSELIDAALSGEDVVIARRGKELVRLSVLPDARIKPEAGLFKGRIRLAADFEAPLEDFGAYTR